MFLRLRRRGVRFGRTLVLAKYRCWCWASVGEDASVSDRGSVLKSAGLDCDWCWVWVWVWIEYGGVEGWD